ncbi:MAG: alkaline phosphatase [Bacteroidales bacterium]|nr:MAG: alkaline phosphatase [Bacteroidales bacterium]
MRHILFLIGISLIITVGCQKTKSQKAKYIFLFIGDGMGIQQVNTTQVYIDSVLKSNRELSFLDFPVQTFATTYAANQYITCSAAAGTALSTGSKTSFGTLGLNYNHTDTLFSIAKKFKESGYKVGLLTSVSIDHATPAAFYAHQGSRDSSYEIALYLLKSGYDFYASGGFLDPYGKKLKNSVESIYSLGQKYSFAFTTSISSIDSLKGKYRSVVYSTPTPASKSTLKYAIDSDSTDVTLAELTKKAIQTLDNPKGFFMMVEGGKIDWACHENDAGTAMGEVIAFSDAVAQAIEFYNAHPDETLIIVTADHETGGFSLGNNENKYKIRLSLLKSQKISKDEFHGLVNKCLLQPLKPTFQEMLNLAKLKLGIGNQDVKLALSEEDLKQLKESFETSIRINRDSIIKENSNSKLKEAFSTICFEILNRKAAIGWASTKHTGSPVPVFVKGIGEEYFNGRLDNTDIPKIVENTILIEQKGNK